MAKLYNFSTELDREFGKPGSHSRERHIEEALSWMREDMGEAEFNHWAAKAGIYA